MQFIQGNNRYQTYFATLNDQVSPDSPLRLMDAFIDKLDLQKLGFSNTIHKGEGRPPFAPAVLLKLYLYGYLNKIRSSRKLEKECSRKGGWAIAQSPILGTTLTLERLRKRGYEPMLDYYLKASPQPNEPLYSRPARPAPHLMRGTVV